MDYYINNNLIDVILKKVVKRENKLKRKIVELENERKIISNRSAEENMRSQYNDLLNKYNTLLEEHNSLLQKINKEKEVEVSPVEDNLESCTGFLKSLNLDLQDRDSVQLWLRNNVEDKNYNKVIRCIKELSKIRVPSTNKYVLSPECVELLTNLGIDISNPLDSIKWLGNDDNKKLPNYNDVKTCMGARKGQMKQIVDQTNISQQCKDLYNKYNLNPNNNMAVQLWLIRNIKSSDFKDINKCQSEKLGTSSSFGRDVQKAYEQMLEKTRQMLINIQINGISQLFDCNKKDFGLDINKLDIALGSEVDKITLILLNEQQTKITLKLWFSKDPNFNKNPQNPKELYVYNSLRANPEYISKFRHMEILLDAGMCDNTINYVKNILDAKCVDPKNKSKNICRANINSALYNSAVKYGFSRYAEFGSLFEIFNGVDLGLIKYGGNVLNLNREPYIMMSLVLQILWQINQLNNGVVIKDLHIENVLMYNDLNYEEGTTKYYRYKDNNNKYFFIKVQPMLLKIIDYGQYLINVPLNIAKQENKKNVSLIFSPQVGMSNYIEQLNKKYNDIFDGPNNNSLFYYIKNSNNIDDVIDYYINKVTNIPNQDIITTVMPNINSIIPDHVGN